MRNIGDMGFPRTDGAGMGGPYWCVLVLGAGAGKYGEYIESLYLETGAEAWDYAGEMESQYGGRDCRIYVGDPESFPGYGCVITTEV